jgi:hypothetical protein
MIIVLAVDTSPFLTHILFQCDRRYFFYLIFIFYFFPLQASPFCWVLFLLSLVTATSARLSFCVVLLLLVSSASLSLTRTNLMNKRPSLPLSLVSRSLLL